MNTITCKHCGMDIELSEALMHQVEEKVKKEISKDLEGEIEKAKREAIEAARKESDEKSQKERAELEKQLLDQKAKNEEFIKKEIELRQEKQKLEEEKKEMDLKLQRQLDEERKRIEEKVVKEEEEKRRFKDKEKDAEIDNLKRMLEEANRKASQVSQQLQGEVLEIDLEEQLGKSFPTDVIEPIAKGVRGGDILQTVKNSQGTIAGSILWETKRAKWTPSWIGKLREDTRKVGASSSILVTEELPKGVKSFGFYEGTLITSYAYALSLAILVRRGIMQTAAAKYAAENKEEKLEMVYQYLQSDAFRHRIEAYVDSISDMKKDLDYEKRAMERIWKKREMQILKAESSLSRLSGELEGLMGDSFPTIKNLSLGDGNDEEEVPLN